MMLLISVIVYLVVNSFVAGYFLALDWEPEYRRGLRGMPGLIIPVFGTILLGSAAVVIGWLFIFMKWLFRIGRQPKTTK